MECTYPACLSLFQELTGNLAQLTELDLSKAKAVRADDLESLNQILKQEQVLSLSLRGLEQRRARLLSGLGLHGVALPALAEHFPAELAEQAKQTVEALRQQYQIYSSSAEVTRNTLECSLHEIEKTLSTLSADHGAFVGYSAQEIEPPPALKTNVRA